MATLDDDLKLKDVEKAAKEAFSEEELKKYLKPDVAVGEEDNGEKALEGVDGGGQAILDDESWEPADVLHEPPHLVVTQPKGSFCQLDSRFSLALPPDDVYNIITDPNNRRVFKNIKEVTYRKVLEDDGNEQRVEVEQVARWRFLVFSGTFASRVIVVQNRKNCTMDFKLAKPGPMKSFEGRWVIKPLRASEAHWIASSHTATSSATNANSAAMEKENKATEKAPADKSGAEADPVVGSWVTLHQVVEPAFVPPWPFANMIRNVSAKLIREILGDMQREALRIANLRKADSKADPPELPAQINNDHGKPSSEPPEAKTVEAREDDRDVQGAGLLSLQGLSLGYGHPTPSSFEEGGKNNEVHT